MYIYVVYTIVKKSKDIIYKKKVKNKIRNDLLLSFSILYVYSF